MTHYKPQKSGLPSFSGISTFMKLPHVQTTENVDIAVVGVPFDTLTSFRPGTRFGPRAIRAMSPMINAYDPLLDIDIFEHSSVIDYGDLQVVSGYTDQSFSKIAEGLKPLLQAGVVPLVLGGDHSITLPELRAAAARYGPVSLVHFDAHLDTYRPKEGQDPDRYSHGNPFLKAAEEGLLQTDRSIQAGIRWNLGRSDGLNDSLDLGFEVLTVHDMRKMGPARVIERIRRRAGDAPVFLSFDIDFVDPAYAPGTGTPVVGGFTSYESLELLAGLQGLNIVAADIVEVLPAHDPSEITALLAAQVGAQIMALAAVRPAQRNKV